MRAHAQAGQVGRGLALALALVLAACSSTPSKPQPGALPAVQGGLNASQAWTYRLPPGATALPPTLVGERVLLTTAQGQLVELQADNGQELARTSLKDSLSTGRSEEHTSELQSH